MFRKTAAMLKWEETSGVLLESVLDRYARDFGTIRELAKYLTEAGTRVTEGTAYLWLRRYQSFLELRRLGYV